MPSGSIALTKEQLLSFNKVTSTGCIEWPRSIGNNGYGRLRANGKLWLAHRYTWTLLVGEIPANTHVLHKCDNPKCININHLFLGTDLDNTLDKIAKGRYKNQFSHQVLCSKGHNNWKYRHNRKHRYCLTCRRESQQLRRATK